jgi:Fe-S cluster assembly iron-binding protein IscA
MLALTTEAQEAIEGLLSANDVPPPGGLRIATPAGSDGGGAPQLQVTVAQLPAEGDQVIDEHGARVFVEETAAEFLDDKILDAVVNGGEVSFAIAEQPG